MLFFITNDCPVANSYAPEIQHICSDYAAKGVACTLVYSDPSIDAAAIRKHRADYGYKDPISAVSDGTHQLAHATGATITPEAVEPAGAADTAPMTPMGPMPMPSKAGGNWEGEV